MQISMCDCGCTDVSVETECSESGEMYIETNSCMRCNRVWENHYIYYETLVQVKE